jgi:hypothetical protein
MQLTFSVTGIPLCFKALLQQLHVQCSQMQGFKEQ